MSAWNNAVNKTFIETLINSIQEEKKLLEVNDAWDIKKEIGELTLNLIYETYGDILEEEGE